METAARNRPFLDADTFLRTDQSEFGNAWCYELVRGAIVAHAAPAPEHGVILSSLPYELNSRLRGHPECRSEVGSGAAPQYEQRDIARIPDVMIRCGILPHVLFEVVSPSELQRKRQRDQRRAACKPSRACRKSWRSTRTTCWHTPTGGEMLAGCSSQSPVRRRR